MKKTITFLSRRAAVMLLVMMLTTATAWATDKTLSGSESYTAQDGDVLTGSTSGTVTIAADAKITLSDVTITGGIVCNGTAEITLVGTNSVTGASQKAGIQVGGSGTTLTIKGDGSLTANGVDQSAGIGLSRAWGVDATGGDILIEGGNITANGSVNDKWGAGIGTGVIYGGTARIGNITIKGGSVKATGGSEANGIGTGYTYGGCTNTIGTVTIYDGIDKVDASSISESVTYMHVENETETDVTANKSDYFTITEDGDRRVIAPKDDTDYTITIANGIEHGSIACAAETAKYGDKVTITATPALGYIFSRLVVKDAQNNDVESTGNTFFMPRSNVTVSAVFEQSVHGTTEFALSHLLTGQGWVTDATIYDGVTTVNLQEDLSYSILKYEGNSRSIFRLDNDTYAADIPYSGGIGTFYNSGNPTEFILDGEATAGYYDITMTEADNGKWNVSIQKTAGQMDVVPDQTYTGSKITPEPTVIAGSLNLTKGTDYVYSYTNNTNVGTATVRATFQGDYAWLGHVEKEFTIVYPTVTTSYVDATGTLHENVEAVPLDNTMTTLPAGTYVVNSDVTVNSRIDLTGDTNLILGDGYTLNVKGIYIPQGSTLTIYAQSDGVTAGKIVSNPTDGAAIGGMTGSDNGNIVIHGGNIEAEGGDHCAGIGSNDGRTGGTISIYGGTVTAKGGSDGAAIGGGRNCSGGTITIYGGTITTDSDPCENGAGIGGGDCGAGGTITIYGGTITTYSRDGAGIGGGDEGDGGTITINGGTITSNKVNQGQGARIGGGCDGAPGTITINGGTITTNGGTGAGIGGGKRNPANGTVTINGGVIDASGSYGIGAGEDGADIAITLGWTSPDDCITASSYTGSVTIADGKALHNGSEVLSSGIVDAGDYETKLNGKTLTPAIILADNADNTSAIATAATLCTGGKTLAVQLSGRTLYKDGDWNTLCLPFALGNAMADEGHHFDGTLLEGATVMQLSALSSWLSSGGELTLTFINALSIEAGKPYIVKWASADNLVNPVFNGVNIINTEPTPVEFEFEGNSADCQFVGNYNPKEITAATNRNNIVVLAGGNKLGYTTSDRTIENGKALGAFRAYFYIPEKDGTTGASSFVLNFGDEETTTGIVDNKRETITNNHWYSLDGRKLDGKPTQKGLYIVNGKKVVIK